MQSFYFVPNKDSFRLTKENELIKKEIFGTYKMRSFYFSPNNNSFRLAKNSSIETEILGATQSEELVKSFYFAPNSGSFKLATINEPIKKEILNTTQVEDLADLANNVKDLNKHKRDFLKIAGVAGLGIVGTALFPKKADALILGGTPTSSVVGVKNVANTRVNPATEETASSILKTSDLTFDAGSLQVKVTSMPGGNSSFSDSGDVAKSGLVDAQRHVQVDVLSSALPTTASTETTLQTISFGGFKFTLRLATVGDVDYVGEATIGTATSAASWRIKRVDSTTGTIIQWAGTGVFDQVWDNRASLSYS